MRQSIEHGAGATRFDEFLRFDIDLLTLGAGLCLFARVTVSVDADKASMGEKGTR